MIISLAGAAYLLLAIFCVLRFGTRPLQPATEFQPSISVLKPIAGDEPGLYENLRSFCEQEYSDYEVVFCLHSAGDPANATVERVVRDLPGRDLKIAVGDAAGFRNPKIANLAKPAVRPRGEIVVVADSDIRVEPNYLAALASSFDTERIGATTCLYTGMPNATLASKLGAVGIEDGFAPSVLVALLLGPLKFCLGATMAARANALREIGGLAALGQELADDHKLGELIASKGYVLELSRVVVRTAVPETRLGELWSHDLRWARTNLSLAPAGYFFSFLMYALPFAIVYAIVSRSLWLLAGVLALRYALHYAARSALHVRHADYWWLVPVRDFWSLALWACSFFGNTVRWRELRLATKSR